MHCPGDANKKEKKYPSVQRKRNSEPKVESSVDGEFSQDEVVWVWDVTCQDTSTEERWDKATELIAYSLIPKSRSTRYHLGREKGKRMGRG